MDKRINCNNCPLCHVEVDTYCEQYCSDIADFIDETRADAIDECIQLVKKYYNLPTVMIVEGLEKLKEK